MCYRKSKAHRFPYIFKDTKGVWIFTELFYVVGSLFLLSIITIAIKISFYVCFKRIQQRTCRR